MGDKVLFQVVAKREVSPAIYCHWSGGSAPDICKRLKERMKDRMNDVPYAAARLVQEAIHGDPGNLSFGITNSTKRLNEGNSPGDAGIVIIDVSGPQMTFTCFGGYLSIGEDGFPKYDENEY